jgi:hypothetical protein
MKSKDQTMLEEAYEAIREGKYMDNYGMYRNVKRKGVTGDPALDAREADRNAGLEDDVESSADEAPSASPAPQAPSQPVMAIDPEVVANKKVSFTVWDPGEYVITLDNKPVGGTFSKSEAEQIVQALDSAKQDSRALSHPLVQSWYRGAKNLGNL